MKFEVGDKVKIDRMDTHWSGYQPYMRFELGDIGKIVGVTENGIRLDLSESGMASLTLTVPCDWLGLVEKGKKLYNGKVICTKFKPNDKYHIVKFTPGKVYTIKDGVLFDDAPPCPYLRDICSLDDIRTRNYVDVDFIEFKGEA